MKRAGLDRYSAQEASDLFWQWHLDFEAPHHTYSADEEYCMGLVDRIGGLTGLFLRTLGGRFRPCEPSPEISPPGPTHFTPEELERFRRVWLQHPYGPFQCRLSKIEI